ncbi:LpxI family protein [Salipiger sp.]|uniref:LpxI family protein n=1 Tax=Salipiger sp. TaxID=2078585 RepID=UPI003A972116
MLALIAGQGALPGAVARAQPTAPLICAMDPVRPEGLVPDRSFRLERLGSFLRWLRGQGVTRVCMCGAVPRPELRWSALDLPTLLLLPRVLRALRHGDDGALRIAIAIVEQAGFAVIGAHEAAPDLLPRTGVPTAAAPGDDAAEAARLGDRISTEQGERDLGQACVIRDGRVIAREAQAGTDAMIATLPGATGRSGILYKAPKPGQERRADLPVIGPATAEGAIRAGLAGIVIEAQGVMVLDRERVVQMLDEAGLFLWVRERPV